MVTRQKGTAPDGLSKAAARWWTKLVADYDISDTGGLMLLENLFWHYARAEQAKAALDADGVTTTDSRGRPKAHPAAAVERDSLAGVRAALKALSLDLEPVKAGPGRPGRTW